MIIKKVVVGAFEANCYLVADKKTKEAIIIDPGDEPGKIFDAIKENNLKPKFILLTHNHPDHVSALNMMKEKFDIELINLKNEEELVLGGLNIKAISTPGHTPDGKCFIIEDCIFTGDTLFKGSIGRTDFEGGDEKEIIKSLKLLLKLAENLRVFPGHGPETTIGEEKRENPFTSMLI